MLMNAYNRLSSELWHRRRAITASFDESFPIFDCAAFIWTIIAACPMQSPQITLQLVSPSQTKHFFRSFCSPIRKNFHHHSKMKNKSSNACNWRSKLLSFTTSQPRNHRNQNAKCFSRAQKKPPSLAFEAAFFEIYRHRGAIRFVLLLLHFT